MDAEEEDEKKKRNPNDGNNKRKAQCLTDDNGATNPHPDILNRHQ